MESVEEQRQNESWCEQKIPNSAFQGVWFGFMEWQHFPTFSTPDSDQLPECPAKT